MHVLVAVALPDRQEVIEIDVPDGATAADALQAARVRERFPELGSAALSLGLWSRPCAADTVLRAGDRVEVYRPLQADPKEQRRARARLNPSSRPRSRR